MKSLILVLALSLFSLICLAKPEEAVVKISAHKFRVYKSKVSARYQMQQLLTSTRVMPNIDPATGKMKGYLLSGVDAKSPVRDLGLEQGDKLMAANDIIFDDAAKGFLAFNTLKDATKIVLSIERKKKPLKIEYELR